MMPVLADVTTADVSLGRHTVHVSRLGTGRPLLLVNGIGGAVGTWDPLRARMQDRHTIAYDAPGTGASPTPVLPLSIHGMATVARRLIDELDLGPVDVLGFSLGGLVAQQLAFQAPGRVRRLVLMSTNTGWGSLPGDPKALRWLFSRRRLRDSDFYEQIAPQLLGGAMRRDPDLVRRAAEERRRSSPEMRGYVFQMMACFSWSTLALLPLLRMPALVLNGDDDPLARPVNARMIAGLLPNGRLYLVEGAGHFLVLERPQELARVVGDFLDEG